MVEHNFKIYKITNTINGKCYIGQTISKINLRWNGHKSMARNNGKGYLHNAIRKYGDSSFKVEVIAHAICRNFLNNLEIGLIKQHNTLAPNGYNLTTGGAPSEEVSDATRKKISASRKGMVFSREHIKNLRRSAKGGQHWKGKRFSKAHRLKLSSARKTWSFSEEHKIAMSKRMLGNTYCLGHKLTEEHKKKIRDSAKRGPLNHNSKGLIHTPYGTFNTTQEAADNLKCAQQTISKRCNKTSPQWSKWYYEKPKSIENQSPKQCDQTSTYIGT